MELLNHEYASALSTILQVIASLLILALGAGIVAIAIAYFIDKNQTEHTIRRNYPVLGRFRYLFEHLGEFFRQYFFAGDREEMPFNRAQRAWVYRAAKNIDRTVAFGSTKTIREPGSVMFLNNPFPPLTQEAHEASVVLIGPNCRKPYRPKSLFNISGMSFGALSAPADHRIIAWRQTIPLLVKYR